MSALSTVLKLMRVGFDAKTTYEAYQETVNSNNGTLVKTASFANNVFILGCTALEVCSEPLKISKDLLYSIKTGEATARFINIPLCLMKAFYQPITFIDAVIIPTVSFLRSHNELSQYHPDSVIRITENEEKKIHVPILETVQVDGREQQVLKGYRALTKDEIEKLKEKAARDTRLQNLGESIFRLVQFTERRPLVQNGNRNPAVDENVAKPLSGSTPLPQQIDSFDFLKLSCIPDALHDDIVFKRYVCPITNCPIRFPVGDPNGVHVYEMNAILREIEIRQRSPMTKISLTQEQLIPKPHLQALIDDRLKFYEHHMRELAQTQTDESLVKAAKQENPKLENKS